MEVTMVRYNVTTDCLDCDGAGSYAITLDLSSSIEHECIFCDGLGERTFPEVSELYESVQELQEEYPKATIERIA